MTPERFAPLFIIRCEDGGSTDPNRTHSLDPDDAGNWSSGARGVGVLIGSNHGVTAQGLALHRRVSIAAITRGVMHALTLGEAVEIALEHYYRAPGLDRLIWNRVTASVFDFGWGAGEVTGLIHARHVSGCAELGATVGPALVTRFAAFAADEARAAAAWAAERDRYYDAVIAANPHDAKYRGGWRARTALLAPGGDLWKAWETTK